MLGIGKLADHTVIERIRQGDEKMLVHLYKSNYRIVKNFILKNNGKEDDVDDVLQDTVIAVWKNAMKPEFLLTSKLSTYVYAIAKNLWYKQLKKRKRFKLVDESDQTTLGTTEIKSSYDKDAIREIVKQMDGTCRELLSLFYFDEMSTKDIASKMNFANANTVKSKKYQCFKKLKNTVLSSYDKEDWI